MCMIQLTTVVKVTQAIMLVRFELIIHCGTKHFATIRSAWELNLILPTFDSGMVIARYSSWNQNDRTSRSDEQCLVAA
jgi:hypothetical protein